MPRVVDHDLRREQIADAVLRTVARLGIEATTVREVAREAGCSTGVLAHYFDDKKALLLFALKVSSRRALARAARTEARRSARDALRGLFIESLPLDGARRLEWTIWVAFIGSAVAEPGFASEQERRYIGWRDHILALLQRARAEGALRPNVDLPAAADRLAATLDGAGIRALFDPKGMSPRRLRAVMEAALGEILRDTPATTIR